MIVDAGTRCRASQPASLYLVGLVGVAAWPAWRDGIGPDLGPHILQRDERDQASGPRWTTADGPGPVPGPSHESGVIGVG